MSHGHLVYQLTIQYHHHSLFDATKSQKMKDNRRIT